MQRQVRDRLLAFVRVVLVAAPMLGMHSTLAAQEGSPHPAGPRRERGIPVPPQRLEWGAAREENVEPGRALARGAEARRPFFSARGAAIGAAVGCVVGAVAFNQDNDEPGSARLGRSAAFCVLLSIPGAFFGSISIP